MEDNKQIVEFDAVPEAPKPEPAGSADDKKEAWGDKSVTRRFLIIALAAAVLINAAISAGMMAAFTKSSRHNGPDMNGGGRPGSELDSGGQGGGMMTPPGGGNGGQSQDAASKVSIGIIITDNSGVYVAKVTGDNAKKAGFKEGDKIVSIDGKDVASSNDLISEVQSHKAGDSVKITVERDGKNVDITTELE